MNSIRLYPNSSLSAAIFYFCFALISAAYLSTAICIYNRTDSNEQASEKAPIRGCFKVYYSLN